MALGPGALARWRAHLEEVIGVDDAASVVDPFYTVEWSKLITTDDLERFATKQDLERFATKQDLERFATKQDLEQLRSEMRSEMKELRADMKELRRDLIRVTGAQFFALVAAIAALVGLS